jgi:hypothetical protein
MQELIFHDVIAEDGLGVFGRRVSRQEVRGNCCRVEVSFGERGDVENGRYLIIKM